MHPLPCLIIFILLISSTQQLGQICGYCRCEKDKKLVDCSFRKLPIIPPLSNNTEELWMDNNPLSNFTNLPTLNVKRLSISYVSDDRTPDASIVQLDDEKIVGLDLVKHFPKLEEVSFENNRFRVIRPMFLSSANHTSLRLLNLEGNQIDTIYPGAFDHFIILRVLNMKRNQIQMIYQNTFNMPQLHILNMDLNRIEIIREEAFRNCSSLSTISLRFNNLTVTNKDKGIIPGAFYIDKSKLQLVDLAYNQITTVLSTWTYGLDTIIWLSLAYNPLDEIQFGGWKYLTSLETLDMSYIALQNLTSNTFSKELQHLTDLYLKGTNVRAITAQVLPFNNMKNLQHLDLTDIALTVFEKESIMNLENLTILRVNLPKCGCNFRWLYLWLQKPSRTVDSVVTCQGESGVFSVAKRNSMENCTMYSSPFLMDNFGSDPPVQCVEPGTRKTLTCDVVTDVTDGLNITWKVTGNFKREDVSEFLEVERMKPVRYTVNFPRALRYTVRMHVNMSDIRLDNSNFQCRVQNIYAKEKTEVVTLKFCNMSQGVTDFPFISTVAGFNASITVPSKSVINWFRGNSTFIIISLQIAIIILLVVVLICVGTCISRVCAHKRELSETPKIVNNFEITAKMEDDDIDNDLVNGDVTSHDSTDIHHLQNSTSTDVAVNLDEEKDDIEVIQDDSAAGLFAKAFLLRGHHSSIDQKPETDFLL